MDAVAAGVDGRSATGRRGLAGRHPVVSYFVLAYAISWTGVALVTAPGGIPGAGEQVAARLPLVALAMMAGPAAAGLLLTARVAGREGLRALGARLVRWRAGAGWYAVALLAAPALLLAALLPLASGSAAFLPGVVTAADRAGVLAVGAGRVFPDARGPAGADTGDGS